MREGWEYKKLGEMASSELGKTLNKSKDTGKLYPYICAVNVLWDMIDLTILKHAFFEKEEIDRYSVRKGDLLVCEGGDTGRSAIWEKEEPVLYQNALHRVRFTTEMEARFAMYCLWHLKNNGQIDQKYSKGVTIKHLVKSSLLSIELPVPPLSTQQSIVSELDKINELIRLKKEQLKDYDNLAQSIFYEMFGDPVVNEKGWEKKRLGEVCSEIKYGTSKPACDNGKYKYLRMCNLSYDGYLDLTDIKRIDVSDEEIEKCIVRYGDILFNRTNSHELIGKTCMFDQQEPMVIAGYIIRVRLTKELMPQVFARMFNLASIKKLLRSMAKGAVNQANINSKELASIQIPIPSLDLQQHFVKRIELIEQQKAEIQSTIADLETLLASRMQYWFD